MVNFSFVRYSACNIECQKQLVANRCGIDAQRLVQDMVQLSVNSVELLSDSVGFPFTMPSQCRNIETGSSSPSSSSSSSPVAPSPYFPQPTYSPNSIQGPQTFYQNQRYHHSHGYSGSNQEYWQARGYQPVPPQNPPNSYPDSNIYRRNNSPFFNPANDQQQQRQQVNQRDVFRG